MSNASGDDELKEALDAWGRTIVASFSVEMRLTKERRDESRKARTDARTAVESLFGRIREAALTPEEAHSLLIYLDGKAKGRPIPFSENDYIAGRSADAKLRRISGGALKEGATQ